MSFLENHVKLSISVLFKEQNKTIEVKKVKAIGEKIRELRLKHGLTLKELGKAIDFNYSNLSKIERGYRKPGVEILKTLANYFNIEITYFFSEDFTKEKKCQQHENQLLFLKKVMKQHDITIEQLRDLIQKIEDRNNVDFLDEKK